MPVMPAAVAINDQLLKSMGDQLNSKTRDALQKKLDGLSLDESEQRAAVLVDLAEVAANEGDVGAQGALLQQAYQLRLKEVATEIQSAAAPQHISGTHPAAAGAARPASPARSGNSSSSASTGSWDDSDEWEPDVSRLRPAVSYDHKSSTQPAASPALLQPFASSPHPHHHMSAVAMQQHSRSALSEPSTSVRPSSSGGGSRPRGRGQSKCGLQWSDSDDEALLLAATSQPHIVEIHGLNRAVTTTHLEEFLLDYIWGKTAPNIKWVDDEHALAVFPCAEAAQVLLEAPQREYRVRPYSKASKGALQMSAEELTPPRSARPKTTTAVARRLIGNALGNHQVRDKAAEKELADLRRANKEERQNRQQQLAAAWGDDDDE